MTHLILLASVAPGSLAEAGTGSKYRSKPLEPVPVLDREIPDPDYAASWHLSRIGAESAWQVTRGERQVTIAVVDSGIDYNDPEISAAIRRNDREWPLDGKDTDGNGFVDDVIGWDFLRNVNLPHDPNGHGTFIAGLIAAVPENGIGSVGVCPGCSILPVRFSDRDGFGETENAVRAFDYAIAHGASVINYSFAGEGKEKILERAIQRAGEKDVLVLVPAGNDAENIDRENTYPARYEMDNLITVTGVDENDDLVNTASWGKRHVHLAAPGIKLIAPWSDRTIWKKGKGTSYATPIVAAAAGLVKSAAPHLKATQIREILLATVRPVAKLQNKVASGGVLDAAAALACASRASLPCLK